MKNLLLILLGSLLNSGVSAKTFTFNFTEGINSRWSQLSNWSNNEYPQNLTDADSVLITAPTNTPGWICHMDTNFTTAGGNFLVGSHVQFSVELGKTFEYTSTQCMPSGSFRGAAGSEMVVHGTFFVIARSLSLGGPLTIYGTMIFEEFPGSDCSQGLNVNGLLKVYGKLSGYTSLFGAKEIWVMKTGFIWLKQGSDARSSLAAEQIINEGKISSDGAGSIEGMRILNSGTIDLQYESTLYIHNFLENTKNISLRGEVNLNGSFINTGSFTAEGFPTGYGNYDDFSFSGNITNKGWMQLIYGNYSMTGYFTNDSVFSIRNREYQYKIVDWNMSGINYRTFDGAATLHFKQPFVNKHVMNLYSPIDSSRINSAFINHGNLTCYGPLVLGAGFINSGQLNLDEFQGIGWLKKESNIEPEKD